MADWFRRFKASIDDARARHCHAFLTQHATNALSNVLHGDVAKETLKIQTKFVWPTMYNCYYLKNAFLQLPNVDKKTLSLTTTEEMIKVSYVRKQEGMGSSGDRVWIPTDECSMLLERLEDN